MQHKPRDAHGGIARVC